MAAGVVGIVLGRPLTAAGSCIPVHRQRKTLASARAFRTSGRSQRYTLSYEATPANPFKQCFSLVTKHLNI